MHYRPEHRAINNAPPASSAISRTFNISLLVDKPERLLYHYHNGEAYCQSEKTPPLKCNNNEIENRTQHSIKIINNVKAYKSSINEASGFYIVSAILLFIFHARAISHYFASSVFELCFYGDEILPWRRAAGALDRYGKTLKV